DHELDVEPKPSAFLEHRLKRRQVDRVLALVVSGAAAVEPIALSRRDPRPLALGPLVVEPADDVAVAVAENGRQARVLDSRGQQHWALPLDRVGIDAAREAHARQGRLHFLAQIGFELRQAGWQELTFRPIGNSAGKIGLEGAAVDVLPSARDGAHSGWSSIR